MPIVSSFRDYIYSKLQCFLIKEHKNRKFIFLTLKFIAEKALLQFLIDLIDLISKKRIIFRPLTSGLRPPFLDQLGQLDQLEICLVFVPVFVYVPDDPESAVKEEENGEDNFYFFGEVTEPRAEKEVKSQEEK